MLHEKIIVALMPGRNDLTCTVYLARQVGRGTQEKSNKH